MAAFVAKYERMAVDLPSFELEVGTAFEAAQFVVAPEVLLDASLAEPWLS